jgi:hypothetical protein
MFEPDGLKTPNAPEKPLVSKQPADSSVAVDWSFGRAERASLHSPTYFFALMTNPLCPLGQPSTMDRV